MHEDRPRLTRRRLLQLGIALPLPAVLAATTAPPQALPPTSACDDGDDPTPAQTEGPYFTPDSPERGSLLEAGLPGERLTVAGTVLATDCRPLRRALLDFWQADAAGQYDNQGYRLRGHQFTDADGRFRLETVVPGLYTGRTRHIHVKVQAPNRPVLTTQLYFPGEAANAADGIFREELLLAMSGDRQASFTFVLSV
jgi:protocatechuate 3,4-dioxygenase beta subunit